MGRQPCCDKLGLKRGPWTIEEDHKLVNFILNNGIQCWRTVPKLAGLERCGKSCRLRWINYLRPDVKRGAFSEMEEKQIIELHACLGNRWSKIASHFPGRTDNEIKNHWNTRIKKRLNLVGIDPVTHKPINNEEKQMVEEEITGHIIMVMELSSPNEQENLDSRVSNSNDYDAVNVYEAAAQGADEKLDERNNEVPDSITADPETISLLNNFYDDQLLLCGNLKMTNNSFSCGSTSLQDQVAAPPQWFDFDSVNSVFSWDISLNQLDDQDELFFSDNKTQ